MELLKYLGYIYLIILALKTIVVLMNTVSWPYLKAVDEFRTDKKVSVLIPARNEEENMSKLLPLLMDQTTQPFEIIVYNDDSTDNTGPLVNAFGQSNSLIKLLQGKSLPKGWLGKNHACHQLSLAAAGDYLLFVDADVLPGREMIQKALFRAEQKQLKLLSLFPQQQMKKFGEMLVVPLMHNILLSLLPLFYVRISHRPAFAAANGQFMFFEAETYHRLKPHAWVKDSPVEDIRIVQLYKKLHYTCETLLGKNTIACRMYTGFHEGVDGFSKNIRAFFGNSRWLMFIYTFLGVAGWLGLPALPNTLCIAGFTLLICYLVLLTFLSGRSMWMLFLSPLHALTAFWVAISSILKTKKGNLEWKGRKIAV